MDQPTLTDGVVWLTPFTAADGTAIGDFNLDEAHRLWFDQPPVDPDADVREDRRACRLPVRTDRPRRGGLRTRRSLARHAARRARLLPPSGRRDGLGSRPMTAASALSTVRNRAREVTTVAFYVSVTLA